MTSSYVCITPVNKPLTGEVKVPGSKSITNRALLLAGLSNGESIISGCLFSDDTNYMIKALRAMGVVIETFDDNRIKVIGSGVLSTPTEHLFLGNAGTATRFLTAACCLVEGEVVVDGDSYMRKRPIQPLLDSLSSLGATLESETGCPPVSIHGRGCIKGGPVTIDGSLSSQYVSAVLMVSPFAVNPVRVKLKQAGIGGSGYIDITLSVMRDFGAMVEVDEDDQWVIRTGGYSGCIFDVEPDASAATYLWALERITGGSIKFNIPISTELQPDSKAKKIIDSFPNMPAVIDGSQIQDAVPTLAVMAAFNSKTVRFVGIENLRVKECDRIAAVRAGLCALKPGLAEEVGDELIVYGSADLATQDVNAEIETFSDHRIAMSFSLAGLLVKGVKIKDPDCVCKTFPEYWKVLSGLGVKLKFGVDRH